MTGERDGNRSARIDCTHRVETDIILLRVSRSKREKIINRFLVPLNSNTHTHTNRPYEFSVLTY